MIRTPLCDLLGIEVPVLGAPMGFVSGAELVAAVSNAGGFGILSFSALPPPALRREIHRVRELTAKPFGVNLLLHFPVEEHIQVCLEERIGGLSLYWGDARPFVKAAHAAGVLVLDQVGSTVDAQRSADAGVDVVIAQGAEAGGHVCGEVSTSVLVPCVVDALGSVPVVAAGGIADGRGLAAALAWGAQGVSIGTRLIATEESTAHPSYKERVLNATESDTVRTTLFGHGWPDAPHRTLRTPFVAEWLAREERGSESRADEPVIGSTRIAGEEIPLQRFVGFPPSRDARGEVDCMAMLAGQGVGLVETLEPAGAVVRRIVEEASDVIERLAKVAGSG